MRRGRGDLSIPRVSNSQASLCLAFIAAGILFFSLGRFSVLNSRPGPIDLARWGASKDSDTLVVYAYANRDWEYPRNLAFFVQHGAPSVPLAYSAVTVSCGNGMMARAVGWM